MSGEGADDFSMVITFSKAQSEHSSVSQAKWQSSKALLSPWPPSLSTNGLDYSGGASEEKKNTVYFKKVVYARKVPNPHEIFGALWILTSRKGENGSIKL